MNDPRDENFDLTDKNLKNICVSEQNDLINLQRWQVLVKILEFFF